MKSTKFRRMVASLMIVPLVAASFAVTSSLPAEAKAGCGSAYTKRVAVKVKNNVVKLRVFQVPGTNKVCSVATVIHPGYELVQRPVNTWHHKENGPASFTSLNPSKWRSGKDHYFQAQSLLYIKSNGPGPAERVLIKKMVRISF